MKDQELDAFIQRLLLDSIRLDEENAVSSEVAFTPSRRYEAQMAKMQADPLAWERGKTRPVWRKAIQRAAVFLLVCVLGFGGLEVWNPSAYAAMKRWAVEQYETHVVYRYSGASSTGEMPLYAITDLPEGYVEIESERFETFTHTISIYRNAETGDEITLNYMYMQQGSASDYIKEDDETMFTVSVNGFEGHLYLRDDWEHEKSVVEWIDSEANLHFNVTGCFSYDAILHIAESVSLVKTTK